MSEPVTMRVDATQINNVVYLNRNDVLNFLRIVLARNDATLRHGIVKLADHAESFKVIPQ